jgi:uracil-DNA glycosylase
VLLLNTCLTVEKGLPNSHKGRGWESFTDNVISRISDEKNKLFSYYGDVKHKKKKNSSIAQNI